MEESVKMFTHVDMLKGLYNDTLQRLIDAKINVEFYKWKETNLTNGQDPKALKSNLLNSQRNVETYSKKLEIIQEEIKKYGDDLHKN